MADVMEGYELSSAIERRSQDLVIVDLRDRPEYRQAVIEQNVRQWGPFTGITPQQMAQLFDIDNARGTLPVTLVALAGERYAGCVSLRAQTMGALTHPEVYSEDSPWLSNMWIADEARGHGLASRLTRRILETAVELGFRRVYSSTTTEDSLYRKLGFETFATRTFQDAPFYLIAKDV